MMNNRNIKKRKWNILFIIPALVIFTIILSFTNSKKDLLNKHIKENKAVTEIIDSVTIELVDISKIDYQKERHFIPILINKKSQIVVGSKLCLPENVTDKICYIYKTKAVEYFGVINKEFIDNNPLHIKLLLQKSKFTNKEDYDNLLNSVSSAIYKLQEIYSNRIYGKSYKSLTKANKRNKMPFSCVSPPFSNHSQFIIMIPLKGVCQYLPPVNTHLTQRIT